MNMFDENTYKLSINQKTYIGEVLGMGFGGGVGGQKSTFFDPKW